MPSFKVGDRVVANYQLEPTDGLGTVVELETTAISVRLDNPQITHFDGIREEWYEMTYHPKQLKLA